MGINFEKALGIHEPLLKHRSQRADVLANNLANTDTPNFKARDITFQEILKHEISNNNLVLSQTNQRHLRTSSNGVPNLLYRTPEQPSIDGNTVEEHIEHAAYMKNSLDFQFSFTKLNGSFKGLMKAIRGE